MNFFGLLTFNAPYLPWVLLGFSLLLGNSVSVDLLGMAVGHCYYFLEDIFPNQPGGFKILKTPQILKTLCDPTPEVKYKFSLNLESSYIRIRYFQDPSYNPEPEERPGGFQWGQNQENENLNEERE